MNHPDDSLYYTEHAGVMAYRTSDFATAIKFLEEVVRTDDRRSRAKLYLGMSYYRTGDYAAASFHVVSIAQHCQDEEIRQQATAVLLAITKRLASTQVAPFIASGGTSDKLPENKSDFDKKTAC